MSRDGGGSAPASIEHAQPTTASGPRPGKPCPACKSNHRTWETLARCLYPRAGNLYKDRVGGAGPWVAVHQMRSPGERHDCPDLILCASKERAEEYLRSEHPQGSPCCGSCARSMGSGYPSLYVVRLGTRIFGATSFQSWARR